MFDFDRELNRKDSDSVKWRKYHGRDIIPMWVADMDFRSPPAVMDALQKRIDHGVFGYTKPGKDHCGTIIDHLRRNFDWEVLPHWIVWLPGVVSGLNVACRSIGSTGDQIVTSVPVYPPFLTAPGNMDRRLNAARMVQSTEGWQIDFTSLAKAIGPQSRMYVLCNPQNPTGRIFNKSELMELAQLCLRNNLVICSDEIHCDLLLEPGMRHTPIASLSPEINQRTITLLSPNKTYNIPGIGCAYAVIANDSLRKRFKAAMKGIVPYLGVTSIIAANAAYQKGQPWLDDLLAYLRVNRDLVFERINTMPGLKMSPVEATYLAWIDVRNLKLPQPPHRWFERAGVGLSDGNEFDGEGFVRLNFGCSKPLLVKALDRIAEAVANL